MLKADDFMQRYIVEPREAVAPHARKEPFIRAKGTPVWVVVGHSLGGHAPAQTAAASALSGKIGVRVERRSETPVTSA